MPAPAHRIEVTLETMLDSVNLAEVICRRTAASAGFGEEDCHRIAMSVREGVINAFHYGNQEERQKKIRLIVEVDGGKFVIHIVDQGSGFDLSNIPDPCAQENLLKTSGRGIFLMRTFMDEFDVHRMAGGGTELVMAKRLPCCADSPRDSR